MTVVTMETGEKMHPFTRLIALPEPIADVSTHLAEVLNQVTTVGQTLRLAGHLASGKQVPVTAQVPGTLDLRYSEPSQGMTRMLGLSPC